MEVKVIVNGLPRVVCGLTKDTTCQEVVIALAQALGQPGRYTLREKFKDFERCMTPSEHVLETLERYGELARDVQLTLVHNGPAGTDQMLRGKLGRYQPCLQLRRKDPGTRLRRGSSSLSLHQQSLPPLAELEQLEEIKRPKRKSLTIMEEAWEWLENLGKGRCTGQQILDIEEQQRLRNAEEEAQQRATEEELEQILFWENELKAETGHEKDLQREFLEMKDGVAECKVQMQGLDFSIYQHKYKTSDQELSKELKKVGVFDCVAPNRMLQSGKEGSPPHALVAPSQIKGRRPTGPSELREWWTRWSQAQKAQNKVIHRSELTSICTVPKCNTSVPLCMTDWQLHFPVPSLWNKE
ncbi:hypothetical protein WMY93_027946 [Mugilogobius chulae]|uniref:Ras-associating domain-containing protein n=1 Tax=Mugilogobius chulae TaxID=88201 RepID=A0AAW0N4R5_9GOBI